MEFIAKNVDVFVPDGSELNAAMRKTTRLAITAHQDDTEIAALHGILECFGKNDSWFGGVTVTNGSGSPRTGVYADISDEEMMAIRRREQRKAALVGEYSFHIQLGYPSAVVKDPSNHDLVDDLTAILQAASADVVYIHNPADKHATHVATAIRSIEAIRRLPSDKAPSRVLGCEVWRGLDWLQDSAKVPLSVPGGNSLSAALLGVFDSQIAGGKRYDLAAAGRRVANATFFASHDTDEMDEAVYAIDLTPLVKNPDMSVSDFLSDAVEAFKRDVAKAIAAVS